ncbi:antitoxin VbhA family protein [Anaerovibrio sp. RM50]|uniref:antitoxin VbhA family protein n=1 Tax=Anaerovibrio sp. RM50 TaxID=1200557 RepID=UPI0012EC13DE|nr:antitoxin VbhA family protein [Anaerovibrio sp. RM50]
MQKNLLSPKEQVRQAVATMAIEGMHVTDDMIKKGLQIAEGKIDVEDVIKELNEKYGR